MATSPIPILFVDKRGQVLAANESAEELSLAVAGGHVLGLNATVERAISAARSLVEVVMVPGTSGSRLYEAHALPMADEAAMVVARDVTLESNLRSSLMDSRQRYKDLLDLSIDFAWELGPDGCFVFVSPRGAFGYTADQLVGHMPAEFVAEQPGIDGLLPFRSEKPVQDAEVWIRRGDGGTSCLLVSSSPLLDPEGRRRGARGVCRDVSRDRERDAALARANNRERLLNYIVRTIRDVVDPSDILKIAAEATCRALGADGCQIYRRGEAGFALAASFGEAGDATAVLHTLANAGHFEGVLDGRLALGATTGHRRDVNGGVLLWRGADAIGWGDDARALLHEVASQLGIAHQQIANHERILLLSRTDALTGLFNRRAFFEELSRRFSRLAREHKAAALIYVDLDNFKQVNDRHGHTRGDEALMAVRDILRRHTRPSDLVARLGGDEFALWLEGADAGAAVRRCEAMLEAAQSLAPFSGRPDVPLTLSLGVAVHDPGRPETLHDLLGRADRAMYAVKRGGKGSYYLASASESMPPS